MDGPFIIRHCVDRVVCVDYGVKETKRGPLEPPIPRYDGFVPRVWTTEAGLGKRYHEMTKNGLADFRHEVARHFDILQQPIVDIQRLGSRARARTRF